MRHLPAGQRGGGGGGGGMGRSEKGDWEENMLTAVIYEGNVYGGKYQVSTDMSLMKVEEKRETFPRGGGKV